MAKFFQSIKTFFRSLLFPLTIFLATSLIYVLGFIWLIAENKISINQNIALGNWNDLPKAAVSESEVSITDTGEAAPQSMRSNNNAQVKKAIADFVKTGGK